jgi:ferredoxin
MSGTPRNCSPENAPQFRGDPETSLAVDWTRCDGHGLCADLAPDLVSRDDWGFPVLRNGALPPAAVKDARRAVAACPALALRLQPEIAERNRP